jgi:hypothetical protein
VVVGGWSTIQAVALINYRQERTFTGKYVLPERASRSANILRLASRLIQPRQKHSAAKVYFCRRWTGRDAPRAVRAAGYSLSCDLNWRLSHAAFGLASSELSPRGTPFPC